MNGLNKEISWRLTPAEPPLNLWLTISADRIDQRLNQDADTTMPEPSAASVTVHPQSCASSLV
jgi:hypothetical protein